MLNPKLFSLFLVLIVLSSGCQAVTVSTQAEFLSAMASLTSGSVIQINNPSTSTPLVFTLPSELQIHSLRNIVIKSTPGRTTFDCANLDFESSGFSIRESQGIVMDGLQFVNYYYTGIKIVNCTNVAVANVRFTNWVDRGVDVPPASPLYIGASRSITVDNAVITNNRFTSVASGICGLQVVQSSDVYITDSEISDNKCSIGSGVLFGSSQNVYVYNLAMERNSATSSPMVIYDSSATFQNSRFLDNTAADVGLGAFEIADVTFIRCDFEGNSADHDVALFHADSSSVTFECCEFQDNTCTTTCTSSLIEAVGQGPSIWPPGISCVDGTLYVGSNRQNISCVDQGAIISKITFTSSIFNGNDPVAPAIVLDEYSELEANSFQLVSPAALSISGGATVDFDGPSRIKGTIQCAAPGNTRFGSNTCGSSACACGASANGLGSGTITCTVPTTTPVIPTTTTPPTCTNSSCVSVFPNGTTVFNFTNGTVVIVTGPPGIGVTPGNASTDGEVIVSPIINVTVNGTGGPYPVNITLPVEGLDPDKNYCLAYFDEKEQRWKCVDECLTLSKDGEQYYATGHTPHLTNFAILLGGSGCGSETTWFQIATIIALGTAGILILIIVLLGFFLPCFRDFVLGSEAVRIRTLRKHVRTLTENELEGSLEV